MKIKRLDLRNVPHTVFSSYNVDLGDTTLTIYLTPDEIKQFFDLAEEIAKKRIIKLKVNNDK